jgi:hypothetical protein
MVTANTMMQAFFYLENPVNPSQAWEDYIGGPVPISNPGKATWGELTVIARALVEAGVAATVLGIDVEQPRVYLPGSNNGYCPGRVIDQGRHC